MFKLAQFAPSIAQDRMVAAQANAKATLAHAKTVVECTVAYANQAHNERKRRERLNGPAVIVAQRTAYSAMQRAKELEYAAKIGVTR